jgi:fructokinase
VSLSVGIDFGGTKIAAVVLDRDGSTRWEARVATPRGDYDASLDAIASLVDRGEEAAGGRCRVGIGIPGAISPATGLIKNANSTWLNARPLLRDLEQRLDRPVRLENDANCLALSECADGAGAGAVSVFAVILGTGVGGGVAVHGRVVTGRNAIAGEWGHNPLPWPRPDELPGRRCYCGKHGCIETFLSGPGLSAAYADLTGTSFRGEDVVSRAGAGDVLALSVLDAWEDRLARALATIVNLLDPDLIVFGGGLSRIPSIYTSIPTRLQSWVFSDLIDTRLAPAVHGDASGVRGAARLWTDVLPSN